MKQEKQITWVGEERSRFENDYVFVFSDKLIDWQRRRSMQKDKVVMRKLKAYEKREAKAKKEAPLKPGIE